ncbi:MAG TPA: PilN domain-containing protein [Candidatus Aminicenantes bacterium]|nr:PilN domain-containing protein [Candidatus Aminicenantes bacterium]
MAKLSINFSSRPRPDTRRSLIALGLLLTLTLAFGAAGWLLLRRPPADPLAGEIDRLEKQARQLSSQAAEWRKGTRQYQGKWQRRVKLANQLITAKTYSYCSLLDELEALIPEGVQITSLSLENGQRSPLTMNVAAASFDRLMELYKTLAPHGLVISKESETGGLFQASIQITMDTGK